VDYLISIARRIKHRLVTLTKPRQPPVDANALTVRLLAPQTASQVAEVFTEPLDPHYTATLTAQETSTLSVYVAWLQAQPVGIAYVHWQGHRNPTVNARMPGVPEIYKVQVARAQRSRGIGALLLTHIEQAMHTRGLSHTSLGVHASNHRAHALYTRLGYVADAVAYVDAYDEQDSTGRVQHHRIEAVLMTKAL
jgi:GNAT superfamily N-acetyltransferase